MKVAPETCYLTLHEHTAARSMTLNQIRKLEMEYR